MSLLRKKEGGKKVLCFPTLLTKPSSFLEVPGEERRKRGEPRNELLFHEMSLILVLDFYGYLMSYTVEKGGKSEKKFRWCKFQDRSRVNFGQPWNCSSGPRKRKKKWWTKMAIKEGSAEKISLFFYCFIPSWTWLVILKWMNLIFSSLRSICVR